VSDKKRPPAELSSALVNDVLFEYALCLGILTALHLDIFDQPGK